MFEVLLPKWLRKQQPKQQPKEPLNLSILVFADIHGYLDQLPECEPDIILLLGDVSRQDVQKIDRQYRCPKLGVLGNHDKHYYFDETNVINLHTKSTTINGITFAGFGGSPRYSDKPYGQYTEDEARAFMDRLGYVDVFIAHSNPRREDRPDLLRHPPHAGFACFTEYIRRVQPGHVFHGHIHEREVYDIGATTVHSMLEVQEIHV